MYSPLCDFIYGPLDGLGGIDPGISNNVTLMNTTDFLAQVNTTKNETGSLIPPAPENLASICDAKSGDREACIDACYDGYSCFSSALDILVGVNVTAPSCYEKKRCKGYIPCLLSIIYMAIPSTMSPTYDLNATSSGNVTFNAPNAADGYTLYEVPRPPSDLPELSSDDSINTQYGAVSCLQYCSKATCCIDLNPETSCISDNVGVCATYRPCTKILEGLTVAPVASESFENATDANSTVTEASILPRIPDAPEDLAIICD
jgi:hypothetical protein